MLLRYREIEALAAPKQFRLVGYRLEDLERRERHVNPALVESDRQQRAQRLLGDRQQYIGVPALQQRAHSVPVAGGLTQCARRGGGRLTVPRPSRQRLLAR